MTKLVATTVVHGASPGMSHGGAYIIDLGRQTVFQTVDLKSEDIEWFGDEGGRGLRGIAIDGETVYLATSNELRAYDRKFKFLEAWRNPYLANCHGICIYQRRLYLASTGNDCILAFDLDNHQFNWAMRVQSERFRFAPSTFDPMSPDGPLFVNKLHLTSVHCNETGMRISGLKSGGVLHFNGKKIGMSLELPAGAQDARFFRNGAVFNDSRAGVLRYVGNDDGEEDRALPVPFYTPSDHDGEDGDDIRVLKRGYARGLCVLSDTVVAGGCTPAGISVHDLKENKRLMTVTFTKDVRTAINCIEIWPF
jgi:hypothetical protein